MHLSKRNTDNGDEEYDTEKYMCEPNPDSSDEEPEHIHEHIQASWLWLFPHYFSAEWPQGEQTQLHALQPEWNADDGYHQG